MNSGSSGSKGTTNADHIQPASRDTPHDASSSGRETTQANAPQRIGNDSSIPSPPPPPAAAQPSPITVQAQPDSNVPSRNPPPPLSTRLTYRLYTSHALSTWNSRLFEFGATLFLASIFPDTLLPMSVYALVRSGAAILFSPAVGSWNDTGDRLRVVRWSIVGQRFAVAGSCALFWAMEITAGGMTGGARMGMFAAVVVLSCVEKLCSLMNLVCIERDWVVVITAHNGAARLCLNARLRRIDLFCKLLAPLVISLINSASVLVAIWVTLGMGLASIVFEYVFIARVYHMVPELAERAPVRADSERSTPPTDALTSLVGRRRQPFLATFKKYLTAASNAVLPLKLIPFYFAHSSVLASLSLSLLYLTVLSFSSQMVTFLLSAGYTSLHVGIARTVSTVVELSATWLAPRAAMRIGPIRGGIWFLGWQMAWLAAGVSFFLAEGRGRGSDGIKAVSGLVAGVVLSRVGLWGFDLCAQGIIQDTVDFSHRGAFSTVEAAFQNLFELLSYASTILFSRPDQFQWPVVISVVSTYLAGALFASYARRKRGHLVHAPPCLSRRYII